jgi:tRNA splicing ligase
MVAYFKMMQMIINTRIFINKGDSFYSNDNGKGNGISLVNNGRGLYLSSMTDNKKKVARCHGFGKFIRRTFDY